VRVVYTMVVSETYEVTTVSPSVGVGASVVAGAVVGAGASED